MRENVYLWRNPFNTIIAPGVDVGLIYNGQKVPPSVDKFDTGVSVYCPDGKTPKSCKELERYWSKFNFSIKLYLIKTGKILNNINFPNSFIAYQLDGKGGINITPNVNLRMNAIGMDKVEVLQCSVRLNFDPVVDFGSIPAWRYKNQLLANKILSVTAVREPYDCEEPFSLSLAFTSLSNMNDYIGDKIDLDNGSILKIYDISNGDFIHFNKQEPFSRVDSPRITKNFDFQVYSETSSPKKMGQFIQYLALTVNYY